MVLVVPGWKVEEFMGRLRGAIIVAAAMCCLCVVAEAARRKRCRQRCRTPAVVSVPKPAKSVESRPGEVARRKTAQEVAQARADWLVRHPGRRSHPPFRVGSVWRHARFEGLAWGRPGASWKRMGTCRPRRRSYRVVADAYATSDRVSVRVRLWR